MPFKIVSGAFSSWPLRLSRINRQSRLRKALGSLFQDLSPCVVERDCRLYALVYVIEMQASFAALRLQELLLQREHVYREHMRLWSSLLQSILLR